MARAGVRQEFGRAGTKPRVQSARRVRICLVLDSLGNEVNSVERLQQVVPQPWRASGDAACARRRAL